MLYDACAADSPCKKKQRKLYVCGACGVECPLDMFGRHQFRKAAFLDLSQVPQQGLPPAAGDLSSHPEASSTSSTCAPAHLVRRCNTCVTQPCCACCEELPLTSFARGQMYRPSNRRRCRPCAVFTLICVRCCQPKPPEAFSRSEAKKRRAVPKVCVSCEQTNPHFERRYTVVLALGFQRGTLPGLPQETLRRIIALSEPGDEFMVVLHGRFECRLCDRSWHLRDSDVSDIDGHVQRSKEHKERLARLASGSLVRVPAAGPEADKLRRGLGVRGAICSAQQLEESRALVSLAEATARGIGIEALRAVGLPSDAAWAAPRVLRAAESLQEGSADIQPAALDAEVKSAQRHWKLYGHLSADGELDMEEVASLAAILSQGS
ncbi:unnamed protein product [Polarella glacialis]|nr:unnamed protein product [Polarella glacialis]